MCFHLIGDICFFAHHSKTRCEGKETRYVYKYGQLVYRKRWAHRRLYICTIYIFLSVYTNRTNRSTKERLLLYAIITSEHNRETVATKKSKESTWNGAIILVQMHTIPQNNNVSFCRCQLFFVCGYTRCYLYGVYCITFEKLA